MEEHMIMKNTSILSVFACKLKSHYVCYITWEEIFY